jgi:hypothetical protein
MLRFGEALRSRDRLLRGVRLRFLGDRDRFLGEGLRVALRGAGEALLLRERFLAGLLLRERFLAGLLLGDRLLTGLLLSLRALRLTGESLSLLARLRRGGVRLRERLRRLSLSS